MMKASVLTIGNFDGVHLGHKKIIKEVVKRSKDLNTSSVLLTFEPHPVMVLNPSKSLGLLSTVEQKKQMILDLGITEFTLIPFSRDLADISARDFFITYLLKPHQPKEIHVGYDFAFGKNREGNEAVLKEYCSEFGIELKVHGPYKTDDTQEIISSSKIREFLQKGNVKEANNLLGYSYSLSNNIIRGDGRGKKIGYPTANLAHPSKLIPEIGVYASIVKFHHIKYHSVTNIGKAPTFDKDRELKVECHFFNFDQDIYGETVTVEFIDRIRTEIKFESVDKLINQIQLDAQKAKEILKSHPV